MVLALQECTWLLVNKRKVFLTENTVRCEMTWGVFLFLWVHVSTKCAWVHGWESELTGIFVCLGPWLWPWLPLWFVQRETKSLNQSFKLPSPFPPLKQLHFGPSGFPKPDNNGGCAAPRLLFQGLWNRRRRIYTEYIIVPEPNLKTDPLYYSINEQKNGFSLDFRFSVKDSLEFDETIVNGWMIVGEYLFCLPVVDYLFFFPCSKIHKRSNY